MNSHTYTHGGAPPPPQGHFFSSPSLPKKAKQEKGHLMEAPPPPLIAHAQRCEASAVSGQTAEVWELRGVTSSSRLTCLLTFSLSRPVGTYCIVHRQTHTHTPKGKQMHTESKQPATCKPCVYARTHAHMRTYAHIRTHTHASTHTHQRTITLQ